MIKRSPTKDEQRLVDLSISMAMAAAEFLHGHPDAEIASWARQQLSDCGFDSEPRGSSHAVLTGVVLK